MLSRERMNDGVSKQLFASVRRNRCMRYETSLANEQKVYSDQGSCIESLYIEAADLYNFENQPRGRLY